MTSVFGPVPWSGRTGSNGETGPYVIFSTEIPISPVLSHGPLNEYRAQVEGSDAERNACVAGVPRRSKPCRDHIR
jgi:hypothetical protein